jgi:polysaccharide deacetylase 2 family uncharacterized protein YibQ
MFIKFGQSILLAVAVSSCSAAEQNLTAKNDQLEVRASVSTTPKRLNKDSYKVSGKILVINHTGAPQRYSNQALTLLLNARFKSRAYLDTVASAAIDFTSIEIKPNSTVSFKVYWAFNLTDQAKVESLTMNLDANIP